MSNEPCGRPYVEAFPSLKLRSVRDHIAADRVVCRWSNEYGTIIGHARILALMPTSMTFRYEFTGTPNVEAGSGTVEIAIGSLDLSNNRSFLKLSCPEHDCAVDAVYFVRGQWACRRCHDLGYRVQRLSPAHKAFLGTDALSLKYSDRSQAASSSGHDNEACGTTVSAAMSDKLLQLPEQLRFATFEHWVTFDEHQRMSGSHDRQGSGWEDGQPDGFAIFRPRRTADPVPGLARFPADIELVGDRLFTEEIEAVLARRFGRFAHGAALRTMGPDSGSGADLRTMIAEAAGIEALQLPAEPRLELRTGAGGRQRVSVTLPYTGNETLWRAKASDTQSSTRLRAEVDDDRVVIAAWVDPGDVQRAGQVIELAVRTIRNQLAAHRSVLDSYAANLAGNVEAYAALWMVRYNKGRADTPIPVTPPSSATKLKA